MAGLTLLLEQRDIGDQITEETAQFNPKLLFDYFAGEVLDNADEATRKFLIKTALLPKFTASMASQLNGIKALLPILNELAIKNYFIYKHAGRNSVYQYHPLFRDFLLAKAEELFSHVELTVTRWTAAELLEFDNQHDAAVQLLMEVEDWEKLAKLIKRCSGRFIKTGPASDINRLD